MLEYLISVRKNIENFKNYDNCIEAYNTTLHKILPVTLADLKHKKFSKARYGMKNVVSAPDKCEAQFAGSSPLTGRNKIVHDIAGMSSDIIRYLYAN